MIDAARSWIADRSFRLAIGKRNDRTIYVNIADVMSSSRAPEAGLAPEQAAAAAPEGGEPGLRYDLIELFFFAYRDFVGQPDAILGRYGFGRAHHRVLHFVDRNPGMTVAGLLDILRITKQSLGRVLKQLLEEGFIAQRPGANDRRQRLLYATEDGKRLARRLASLQSERIEAALSEVGGDADALVARFLFAMIAAEDRDAVARALGGDEASVPADGTGRERS